jgi:hypothetical protein
MNPPARTVLILGRRHSVVDDAEHQLELDLPGIHLLEGISIDDVRSAFAQTKIDHVIMGAGIDLDTRLQIIGEIFQTSDTTSVHMKDRASGPQGFLPFIRSVLRGLDDQPS